MAGGTLYAGERVAVVIPCVAAARLAFRWLAFAQVPVFGGLDEGGVEDRGRNIEPAAGFGGAAHASAVW
jgi:hypothetical protein